jgi:hypothetical protein
MALKIKPPTHKADSLGVFVSVNDPAWNDAVYIADMEALVAAALREKQDAAEAAYIAAPPNRAALDGVSIAAVRAAVELTPAEHHKAKGLHPVVRYVTGKTRFQIGADDWTPDRKPCTVRERYLTEGAACEFTLRRLRHDVYQAADEITSTGARLTAFARASLRAVKSPDYNWTAGADETRAPEEVLQVLHDADPALLLEIGTAVIAMCRPLDVEETFH